MLIQKYDFPLFLLTLMYTHLRKLHKRQFIPFCSWNLLLGSRNLLNSVHCTALYCTVLHLQCIVPQQVRWCLQFCIKPRSWMWGLDMRIRALLCGQRQQQGRDSVTSFHLLAFPVTCHVICSCILVVTILWKPGTCYLYKVWGLPVDVTDCSRPGRWWKNPASHSACIRICGDWL